MDSTLLPLTTFKEQFNFVPEIIHHEHLRAHSSVVVCGMGGSAICVSLLKMLFPELSVSLHNSYGLPSVYNKETTLIILNSYSGNTEEILEGFDSAKREDCNFAVISCGGKLLQDAQDTVTPYVQIPTTDLEPRFAIGYQLIGILALMGEDEKIKILKEKITQVQINRADKDGKFLAEKLSGKYPVIYSSSAFSSVAYLIKAAINEGAKLPCFVNIIPEANHNELQSFVTNDTYDERAHFGFLCIQSTFDHTQITKRFSTMKDLFTMREFVVETIEKDETNMVDIFEIILTGYFLATYLAIARNVDPYKTPFIAEFKHHMSL